MVGRERRFEGVPKRELSLFDSTCLIMGIIIGVGIFQTAPDVAKGTGSLWGVLAIWTAGGLLSLCGALNYSELASAYPGAGGDYIYLTRAYGPWAGFLFGWAQLVVVRPGDIAVVAFAFAMYARALYDPLADTALPYGQQVYAIGAVVVLTAINIAGVRQGKWTQNLLTIIKALGLLAIVGVAVISPHHGSPAPIPFDPLPLSVAMILVLFTFGGWNEMAYVAAEVKNPDRNILRALVLGTVAVTLLYLLANGAYLRVLGFNGVATSEAVATDTVSTAFPVIGGRMISALICISALGAVSGLIFAGARISYAVGAEHWIFHGVGKWNSRTGTPVRALLLQGAIAVSLVVLLGSFVSTILYTAAAVYSFYLASSVAVVILRYREPQVRRPYRVSGYPVTTILFAAVCAFLVYSAAVYRPWVAATSCLLVLVGLPLHRLSARRRIV